MKKRVISMILCLVSYVTQAQELFVVTEPASNMPTKSIGVRVSNYFMNVDSSNKTSYHVMPEIMLGLSKKWMAHVSAISSNRLGKINVEGLSLYTKYRFLSIDNVHRHFRMAGFARWSSNNTPIHMHEVNLLMHNSGYESGLIATQLLHKVAISGTASIQKATSSSKTKWPYEGDLNKSINYSFSLGKLLLPKKYTSYKQANVTIMAEFLGQYNLGDRRYYLDIVPSVQVILNSIARIDLAWREELRGSLHRSSTKGFILKFEYNFFNALK
jgi:hypothetical protein